MNRIIAFLFAFPFLMAGWGFANASGLTDLVSQETGVAIPKGFDLPGVDRIWQASDAVRGVRDQAARGARQTAIKELRSQVRARYGDEAADAIPGDIPSRRLRNLRPSDLDSLTALAKALGVPALADLAKHHPAGGGVGSGGGGLPAAGGKPGRSGGTGASGGAAGAGSKATITNGDKKLFNQARKLLPKIEVKPEDDSQRYSRSAFGKSWDDDAGDFPWTGNGCDTRNDVLARDLIDEKTKPGGCKVISGLLPYEPYTGARDYRFDSTDGKYETDLDIEHLASLGWSWRHGASAWAPAKRAALANDPANLFVADPSSNRAKADQGPGTWLPPNKAFHCAYVSRTVVVVSRYGMWLSPDDKRAIVDVLDRCPR